MKRLRNILMSTLMLMMIISTSVSANDNYESGRFKDVSESHWAYDNIKLMSDYGIINGYDGSVFNPDGTVTRAEFAKMMVMTMQMDTYKPSTPSFVDVAYGNWAYPYIETAKPYLTGYRIGTEDYFRPERYAEREEMAVAIVKGLGIDAQSTDMTVLDAYTDTSQISPNLRMYVAAAINEGIMIGSGTTFNPRGELTRAEAATLLARLITEEKVTYDEEKVTYDENAVDDEADAVTTPVLEGVERESDVVLEWSPVTKEDLSYYKVVLSLYDETPQYSENGYLFAISDRSKVRVEIEAGQHYNNGDLGGQVVGGETYYMAITAVYKDGSKYTSNVLSLTVPEKETSEETITEKTPVLSYAYDDGGVRLSWSQTPSSGFNYYKVVLSRTKENPYYPDYGYLTYITNASETSYLVLAGSGYNDGSVGGIGGTVTSGSYYMTITAVYGDGKYTSNAIYVTVP